MQHRCYRTHAGTNSRDYMRFAVIENTRNKSHAEHSNACINRPQSQWICIFASGYSFATFCSQLDLTFNAQTPYSVSCGRWPPKKTSTAHKPESKEKLACRVCAPEITKQNAKKSFQNKFQFCDRNEFGMNFNFAGERIRHPSHNVQCYRHVVCAQQAANENIRKRTHLDSVSVNFRHCFFFRFRFRNSLFFDCTSGESKPTVRQQSRQ